MVKSTNGSLVDFGAWFGILGVPLGNNPFHERILGIQTTNLNPKFTVGWWNKEQKKLAIGPLNNIHSLGIQSYSQMMIRVSNHLLSIVFV